MQLTSPLPTKAYIIQLKQCNSILGIELNSKTNQKYRNMTHINIDSIHFGGFNWSSISLTQSKDASDNECKDKTKS